VTGGDVSRFQRRSMPRQESKSGANAAGQTAPQKPKVPSVRVSRGNNVTIVELGGK
jgi:pilus assembly protein CpaB